VFSVGQTVSAVAIPAIARLTGSPGITPTFRYFGYAAAVACVFAVAVSLKSERVPHAAAEAAVAAGSG
jgi:hypothetical protein